MEFQGKIFIYGDNIDTDQIYPGRYLELTEPSDIVLHAMEGADPAFASSVRQGDIIIAGTNFGCGSSREHAVITLKRAGVGAVVAKSFARIFYRNAINQGLPVVEIPDMDTSKIRKGETASIDISKGSLSIGGESFTFQPLPKHILSIIEAGGIFKFFKERGIKAFG